jgi:hypothetical protein
MLKVLQNRIESTFLSKKRHIKEIETDMSDLPRVTLHDGEFYQILGDDDSLHDYIKAQFKGTMTKSPVVIKAKKNGYVFARKGKAGKAVAEHMSENGLTRPLSKEQLFLRIDDNVVMYIHQGEGKADILEYLKGGSFLNIQNPDDIYGVAGDEFQSAYRITDSGSEQVQKDIDRILKEL